MDTSTDIRDEREENESPPATAEEALEEEEQPEGTTSSESSASTSEADEATISEAGRLHERVSKHIEDDEDTREALGELARRAEEGSNAQSELMETRDKLMRKAASLQNARRRSRKEQTRAAENAKANTLRRVLDVLDDFERSLEATDQVTDQEEPDYKAAHHSLKEGVEMVYDKFRDVLREMDVVPIEAVGQRFDEKLHEAMMQQPASGDAEPGEVLHETQKGYRMGDRVLRHSRVIVAGPPEEDEDEA